MKKLILVNLACLLSMATPAEAGVLNSVGHGLVRAVKLPLFVVTGATMGAAGGLCAWMLDNVYSTSMHAIYKSGKEPEAVTK